MQMFTTLNILMTMNSLLGMQLNTPLRKIKNNKKMRLKFKLLTAIFILLISGAKAQETTSEIRGTVSDSKSGVLSGATITAIHMPTGTKYVTTTRKDGRYNLANLRIGGPYELKVTFVGFNESTQGNINLLLGQEFKVDFKMMPSSSTRLSLTML